LSTPLRLCQAERNSPRHRRAAASRQPQLQRHRHTPAPVPANSSVTVSLAPSSGVVGISPATQSSRPANHRRLRAYRWSTAGSVVLTATATGYNNAIAPLTVTRTSSASEHSQFGPGQNAACQSAILPAPAGLTINFSSANLRRHVRQRLRSRRAGRAGRKPSSDRTVIAHQITAPL